MFMQMTLPDSSYAAYIKGRRDEQAATVNVMEYLRIQGLLDIATCQMILTDLDKVDRRIRKEDK
jgi:protein-arginine kinase